MLYEAAAPIVSILRNENAATVEKIKRDVYQTITHEYPNGNIRIGSSALVIYGEK